MEVFEFWSIMVMISLGDYWTGDGLVLQHSHYLKNSILMHIYKYNPALVQIMASSH